jgi:hypothetical protein
MPKQRAGGKMTLQERVVALEDAVRKLGTVVAADVESLRVTDAEVARQAHRRSSRIGWPKSLDGER